MLAEVVTLQNLREKGWTDQQVAECINALIQKEDESLHVKGDFIAQLLVQLKNPNNQLFLLHDETLKTIGGFVSVRPLEKELYERVRKGDFEYKETNEMIAELKGEVYLYIGGITIADKYRNNIGNFKHILNALLDYIYSLVTKNIVIKEVITRTLTEDGKRLCMALGMKYICDHKEEGQIFSIAFSDPSSKQTSLLKYLSGMKNSRV